MRSEIGIECVDDVGDFQILRLRHGGGKPFPEIAQHLPPIGIALGHLIKLVFQPRRKAGIDIMAEEAGEEGGY